MKKIRRRTKVKKNKQPVLLDDETPKRRPLGREFHKNKENQRWDSHNKMGKSRKRTAGQKKQQARRLTRSQKEKDAEYDPPSSKEDDDPDLELGDGRAHAQPQNGSTEPQFHSSDEEGEPKPTKRGGKVAKTTPNSSPNPSNVDANSNNPSPNSVNPSPNSGNVGAHSSKEEMMAQIARLKRRAELQDSAPKTQKSACKPKLLTALEKEVVKMTKQDLWQKAKIIKSDQWLRKCSLFVLRKINPKEMDGLNPEQTGIYEEEWLAKNSNLVRTALNGKRGNVQHELRDLYLKVLGNGEGADWPSEHNILRLAMRDRGTMEEEVFDGHLVKYWDNLLLKVSGNTYWNPNRRHYGNPSTLEELEGTQSHLNVGKLIDPSTEAFLVWTFENAYSKWLWITKEKALKIQLKDKETTEAEIEKQRLADNATPYTDANGGQQKWGGITQRGQERFEELVNMITKNRVDNKDAIKVVEDRVLKKVRAANKRDAIDAKRMGKKKPKKKVAPVVPEEDVNEEDFTTWI